MGYKLQGVACKSYLHELFFAEEVTMILVIKFFMTFYQCTNTVQNPESILKCFCISKYIGGLNQVDYIYMVSFVFGI